MTGTSAFWDDLAHDLEDPEFLREFVVESMRIATIDEVVNALDDAREAAGLSKAELARDPGRACDHPPTLRFWEVQPHARHAGRGGCRPRDENHARTPR